MTRKRFIKLYMSYGYSRNHANYMADLALLKFKCYKLYYNSLEGRVSRGSKQAERELQKGIESIWQTMDSLVLTMQPLLNRVAEAFKEMERV